MMIAQFHSSAVRARRVAEEFDGLTVHLVGVGGWGMLGAARILLEGGAVVSGSDLNPFSAAAELIRAGATIHVGHDAGHLPAGVHLVVRSAAVPDTNSEITEGRRRSVPVIHYAEFLGWITRARRGVSVSGTHGKSTTTALTAHIFRHAGLSPSFIVGASCRLLGGSSGLGLGQHFIVESCEYGRSFLHLRPHSAAILNVEADHLDCYRDLDDIVAAFSAYARRISSNGLLVVNHDDPRAMHAAAHAVCKVETFGFDSRADWWAAAMRSNRACYAFQLMYRDRFMTRCRLKLAGRHNVGNALAAAALASEAGIAPARIASAMATFDGVDRRMTLRGTARGITIVDDYAHHPTEIRATLRAVRKRYAPKRTWVVFQPHQASRTRLLIEDFVHAFEDADVVLVPDIYTVRDTDGDRQAIASSGLVDRIRLAGKDSRYMPSFEDVFEHLLRNVGEGDVVVTMGAGDVWKVADGLVERVC